MALNESYNVRITKTESREMKPVANKSCNDHSQQKLVTPHIRDRFMLYSDRTLCSLFYIPSPEH